MCDKSWVILKKLINIHMSPCYFFHIIHPQFPYSPFFFNWRYCLFKNFFSTPFGFFIKSTHEKDCVDWHRPWNRDSPHLSSTTEARYIMALNFLWNQILWCQESVQSWNWSLILTFSIAARLFLFFTKTSKPKLQYCVRICHMDGPPARAQLAIV